MGSFGTGPFANDDAVDFLAELAVGPARGVTRALQSITQRARDEYLDVDLGNEAWAASELVALSFGYAGNAPAPDEALAVAARLKPAEAQRVLALEALARVTDRAHSELADLWHPSTRRGEFTAAIADLRARLESAAAGPRALPRLGTGDVLALPAAPDRADLVVMQVVGAREVAMFQGTQSDDRAALAAVASAPARRVPTALSRLAPRVRVLGNAKVRKDLKGKKLYAMPSGALYEYSLATASGGDFAMVDYERARAHDVFRSCGVAELRAVALGGAPEEHLPSPDEREAEYRARNAAHWAERRATTTPEPFGDVDRLREVVEWMRDCGVPNAVQRFDELARGMSGYGRPEEHEERRSYAFAGIVALWVGKIPAEAWPQSLRDLLPPAPGRTLLRTAIAVARALADGVITRDAELRFIWGDGPELSAAVARLKTALASPVE